MLIDHRNRDEHLARVEELARRAAANQELFDADDYWFQRVDPVKSTGIREITRADMQAAIRGFGDD